MRIFLHCLTPKNTLLNTKMLTKNANKNGEARKPPLFVSEYCYSNSDNAIITQLRAFHNEKRALDVR